MAEQFAIMAFNCGILIGPIPLSFKFFYLVESCLIRVCFNALIYFIDDFLCDFFLFSICTITLSFNSTCCHSLFVFVSFRREVLISSNESASNKDVWVETSRNSRNIFALNHKCKNSIIHICHQRENYASAENEHETPLEGYESEKQNRIHPAKLQVRKRKRLAQTIRSTTLVRGTRRKSRCSTFEEIP